MSYRYKGRLRRSVFLPHFPRQPKALRDDQGPSRDAFNFCKRLRLCWKSWSKVVGLAKVTTSSCTFYCLDLLDLSVIGRLASVNESWGRIFWFFWEHCWIFATLECQDAFKAQGGQLPAALATRWRESWAVCHGNTRALWESTSVFRSNRQLPIILTESVTS